MSPRLLVRKLDSLTLQGRNPVESVVALRMEVALKYDKKRKLINELKIRNV